MIKKLETKPKNNYTYNCHLLNSWVEDSIPPRYTFIAMAYDSTSHQIPQNYILCILVVVYEINHDVLYRIYVVPKNTKRLKMNKIKVTKMRCNCY